MYEKEYLIFSKNLILKDSIINNVIISFDHNINYRTFFCYSAENIGYNDN